MTEEQFVTTFGGVYEHSAWVARETWARGISAPHDTAEGLAEAMAATVAAAGHARQLRLIKAHPDLAGRAAVRGELGAASAAEQSCAGLDQCSAEEYARFQSLNNRYQDKFGFPFVMAVRGNNRQAILAAFEIRIDNEYRTEFAKALSEIDRIARFRLDAMGGA